jgi:hypothetical protein
MTTDTTRMWRNALHCASTVELENTPASLIKTICFIKSKQYSRSPNRLPNVVVSRESTGTVGCYGTSSLAYLCLVPGINPNQIFVWRTRYRPLVHGPPLLHSNPSAFLATTCTRRTITTSFIFFIPTIFYYCHPWSVLDLNLTYSS